jgi:hypothetical protein
MLLLISSLLFIVPSFAKTFTCTNVTINHDFKPKTQIFVEPEFGLMQMSRGNDVYPLLTNEGIYSPKSRFSYDRRYQCATKLTNESGFFGHEFRCQDEYERRRAEYFLEFNEFTRSGKYEGRETSYPYQRFQISFSSCR